MSNHERNQKTNKQYSKKKVPKPIRASGITKARASLTSTLRTSHNPFEDVNDEEEDEAEQTQKDYYSESESDFIITLTGLNQLDTLGKYNLTLQLFGEVDIKHAFDFTIDQLKDFRESDFYSGLRPYRMSQPTFKIHLRVRLGRKACIRWHKGLSP